MPCCAYLPAMEMEITSKTQNVFVKADIPRTKQLDPALVVELDHQYKSHPNFIAAQPTQ